MDHGTLARTTPSRALAIWRRLASRVVVDASAELAPAQRWHGRVGLLLILGASAVLWIGIIAVAKRVMPPIA